MTVTVRSFAKINLGLRIGAVRSDGFHDLLTVYQTISLHDLIHVTVVRGSGIEICCADPRVPKDESNTCFRIAQRAMETFRTKARVVIEIEKRLPVQGGLGGASANAVATLLGLERALRKKLPPSERLQIAAEVGSDLPLFLISGTILGVGRGEQVFPLPDLPRTPVVVLTPEVGVSTPKAFAAWDRLCGAGAAGEVPAGQTVSASTGETAEVRKAWPDQRSPAQVLGKLTAPGPFDRMNELGRALSAWLSEPYSGAPLRRGRAENPLLALVRAGIENDFEQVVFPEYPELGEAKRALIRAGASYASLSGSGSTLYGLFASQEAAAKAVRRVRTEGWAARASSTLSRRAYWSRIFDC